LCSKHQLQKQNCNFNQPTITMKNLILLSLLFVSLSARSQTPGNTTTAMPIPEGHKIKKVTVKTSYKVSALKGNITVQNANGFTSTFNRTGNTATIVNSDGTQSTIIIIGNTASIKNSNGTNFTVVTNGNVSIITIPSGGVATVTNNGSTSTIANADGTTSTVNNYGNVSVMTYPNGTAYATFNYADMTINDPSAKPVNGIAINPEGGITAGFTLTNNKPVVNTYSGTSTITTTVPMSDNTPDDGNVTYTLIDKTPKLAELAMAGYWARPAIEHVLVTNISAAGAKKFEINLFTGSNNYKKARDLVLLFVSTASAIDLSDGTYNYSPVIQEPFKFNGAVKSGKDEIAIVDGTFYIKTEDKNLTVDYALKLANGKRITGKYNGKYQTGDRSK
jgi:hypothetical protein